jgi:two-component system sensor histidine kinase SenX3
MGGVPDLLYLAAVPAAVAAVALIGWMAFRAGRRRMRDTPIASATDPIAARALAAAAAGHRVLDRLGGLVLSNRSATELGIVHDGLVDPRIVRRVLGAAGRSDTEETDAAWEISGEPGRPEVLRLTAQPLGDGLVLVTATDETAARRAELVRRDFVANVSHELKSPVTAIGLLAEAVGEAADSPETVRGFAGRMQREAGRLGTLITELIALSAIQDGRLDERDLVPVDEVVADAVDRIAVTASAAGIAIRTDDPSGALVLGDRSLLTTAIGNLVENAVHYSGAGSTVTVSRVLRRGQVEIAVADRGIGIAPQDQQRVFERFFRADPARSRATGGTGLGLAIVKHVAANHGGSIRLWSRVGEGSTFTLRLPAAEPPAVALGSADVPRLPEAV